MPDFIVTTKHSVLTRYEVKARTKYDAVAALTAASHKGEGLPAGITIADIEVSVPQIHSVGVIKDSPGDSEPEAPDGDAFGGPPAEEAEKEPAARTRGK